MLNHIVEAKGYDPDGNYVRRWLPALARLPLKWIHKCVSLTTLRDFFSKISALDVSASSSGVQACRKSLGWAHLLAHSPRGLFVVEERWSAGLWCADPGRPPSRFWRTLVWKWVSRIRTQSSRWKRARLTSRAPLMSSKKRWLLLTLPLRSAKQNLFVCIWGEQPIRVTYGTCGALQSGSVVKSGARGHRESQSRGQACRVAVVPADSVPAGEPPVARAAPLLRATDQPIRILAALSNVSKANAAAAFSSVLRSAG